MTGDFQPRLNSIDNHTEASRAAEERLDTVLGGIVVDIEVIANLDAVEAIKHANPGVNFEVESDEPMVSRSSIYEHLMSGIEDAIEAKKESVLANYNIRVDREKLLNDD